SPDVDQWHLLVDALATPLLWGAEGEPIEGFAVGGWPAAIGDDYFHDVPPRGDERQLQAARARLQQLLQSPGDAGGAG
nr:hypothetical protein [Planctomycetales bacterium]NIM08942.1 hypothetical protein [Planctomycetales bacterium]NIN08408.1 hypothetical protein [Planctomycetales bacterium]NIN77536.1 hypothetical protein [Planctomycetales bacterium]NIO34708.1 hypothetical protein [Planctomycetales bacterium]